MKEQALRPQLALRFAPVLGPASQEAVFLLLRNHGDSSLREEWPPSFAILQGEDSSRPTFA